MLQTGDRLNQEEFHRAYEQTPEGFAAELIGGIVYVQAPHKVKHGSYKASLAGPCVIYKAATPGIECGNNVTILLGHDSEPQPDLYMRICPEFGGQSRTLDDYVKGAPEFILEVALSAQSIELHGKLNDYKRHGVLEYLVVCIEEKEVRWFDLCHYCEITADPEKVYRSRCLPGMWIDADALLFGDLARLLATANRGTASPEHNEFVAKLAAAGNTV